MKPPRGPHNAVDRALYERRQRTELRQLCMAISGELLEALDKAGTSGVGVDVLLGICRSRGLSRAVADKVLQVAVANRQFMIVGKCAYLTPKMIKPPEEGKEYTPGYYRVNERNEITGPAINPRPGARRTKRNY